MASRLFSEVVQFVTHFALVAAPLLNTKSFSLNLVIAALLVNITTAKITEETVVARFLLNQAVLALASKLNCVEPGGLLLDGRRGKLRRTAFSFLLLSNLVLFLILQLFNFCFKVI